MFTVGSVFERCKGEKNGRDTCRKRTFFSPLCFLWRSSVYCPISYVTRRTVERCSSYSARCFTSYDIFARSGHQRQKLSTIFKPYRQARRRRRCGSAFGHSSQKKVDVPTRFGHATNRNRNVTKVVRGVSRARQIRCFYLYASNAARRWRMICNTSTGQRARQCKNKILKK